MVGEVVRGVGDDVCEGVFKAEADERGEDAERDVGGLARQIPGTSCQLPWDHC